MITVVCRSEHNGNTNPSLGFAMRTYANLQDISHRERQTSNRMVKNYIIMYNTFRTLTYYLSLFRA